jgi:hypothetical protein
VFELFPYSGITKDATFFESLTVSKTLCRLEYLTLDNEQSLVMYKGQAM